MTDPNLSNDINKVAEDLGKKGEMLLTALWNKFKLYVFLAWGFITVLGITGSLVSIYMYTNATKKSKALEIELLELKKKEKAIDKQIVYVEKQIDRLVHIEKTNFIVLTNMEVRYASNIGVYARFASNSNWLGAIEYYKQRADTN